jgi:hypothetical protein
MADSRRALPVATTRSGPSTATAMAGPPDSDRNDPGGDAPIPANGDALGQRAQAQKRVEQRGEPVGAPQFDREHRFRLGDVPRFVEGEDCGPGEILRDLGAKRAPQELLGEAHAIAPRCEGRSPERWIRQARRHQPHAHDGRGRTGYRIQGVSRRPARRASIEKIERAAGPSRLHDSRSRAIVPSRTPAAARRRLEGRPLRASARRERGGRPRRGAFHRPRPSPPEGRGAGQRAVQRDLPQACASGGVGRPGRAERATGAASGPAVRAAPQHPGRHREGNRHEDDAGCDRAPFHGSSR